ncbi:MAG: hypothetical protein WKF97_06340 [Chitinophagaceae bacterium]
MKIATINILIFCLLMVSCKSNKELDREDAFRQIQEGRQYPKVIDYDIYCGDPQHAKKVLDAGLETTGLLTVRRTQKLGEIGSPLIHFTDKAQPYLLPTPEKDRSSNIQKVKIGEEQLLEVTGIKTGQSGKDAIVEYTTSYKNLTPFSILVSTDYKQNASRKANFSLHDDGWKLEK